MSYVGYNREFTFLGLNIIYDLLIMIIYLRYLAQKNHFLFPSSLFIYIFYIYSIFGKLIWLYREENWFNEVGSPEQVAVYFSNIGMILIFFSSWSIQKRSKKLRNKIKEMDFTFSINKIIFLTVLTFFGAYLFTNQFRHIALFSDEMDATRVLTNEASEGGRGIGFALLTFGIIANSLILLQLKKFKGQSKFSLFCLFLLNTLFLALYSGRFLPMIPLVIYFIIINLGKEIYLAGLLKRIVLTSTLFILLMYFGARRAFGSNADSELIFRFFIADSFPEFRMTVYTSHLTTNDYFDNFFFTIFSGLIPGPFFSLFGLNKFDYFKPIGAEILKVTHFDPVAIPGIRTSLFGELYFTGFFIPFFLAAIVTILLFLDKLFFQNSIFSFKKFRIIAGSIFLCFSIPYGSLYLVSCMHFFIALYFTEKSVLYFGRTH